MDGGVELMLRVAGLVYLQFEIWRICYDRKGMEGMKRMRRSVMLVGVEYVNYEESRFCPPSFTAKGSFRY